MPKPSAIPNATQNKEMYQNSNCFLDVGSKAIVDASTKLCTLTTATGKPTLFTCSDILLLELHDSCVDDIVLKSIV
jgi:hypothetical protein